MSSTADGISPTCRQYDIVDGDGDSAICTEAECSGECGPSASVAEGADGIPCSGPSQCYPYAMECDDTVGLCFTLVGMGDPAFVTAVPTSAFRQEHFVPVAAGYGDNYLTVVSCVGHVPVLSGTAIDTAS